MKLRSSFVALSLVGAVAIVISCSATSGTHFGNGGVGNGSGSGNDGMGNGTGTGNGVTGIGGSFVTSDAGNTQCTGLQCVAQMDNCAGQGKKPTSITGFVYDPAGNLPLYNVYVYIPNTTPDAITAGNPTCTQCEAPASGSPVVGVLTDATGYFNLTPSATDMWGVPSGDNLPLVLQVGKWRRQIVLPHINACTLNPLPNPPTPADKLRLPAKSSEGDMPLIAFTSGCDPAECFLRHVGIDDSEFVPPGSTTGHVHFYTGQDAESSNPSGDASKVAGGNTSAQTYQWWTQSANLLKYDIVFNACECNPNDRGAGAYQAMHDYLDGGGRVFTTHYYYNWFAPPTGSSDFQSVVNWALPEGFTDNPYQNFYIDTSFPKGMAFAQWLQSTNTTQTLGQIALADTRYDMNSVTSESTRWIYNADTSGGNPYATMYMSFNAPVTAPSTMQCGRAVYSDVHLSGTSDDTVFPQECNDDPDPDGSHAINEKALEFLFFDLSSCVQDNSMPPPPPPTQ
jgi:hypothetical protein